MALQIYEQRRHSFPFLLFERQSKIIKYTDTGNDWMELGRKEEEREQRKDDHEEI
jgi:hypothetical protein